MTAIFCDGFDIGLSGSPSGGIYKWNVTEGLAPTASSPARSGSWNAIANGATAFNEHQVEAGAEHATFIVGVAWNGGVGVASAIRDPLIVLKSDAAATSHVALVILTTGALAVYRGASSAGTLLGTTAAGVMVDGSYQYVEMKATLDDSTGVVVVRVDELEVLHLTGLDTKNGGTKTVFDSFRLRLFYSGVSDGADDFYVCNGAGSVNNDFLGAIKIETLYPTGNGNSSQWVGSDGNSTDNYLLVDDPASGSLINTGDYVEGSSTGDEDTYVHGNSTQPTGNAVRAVFMHAYAQKNDAGARELAHVARLSGTETSTASVKTMINGTMKTTWAVSETKPGGGAWTVNDVNNAEFGIKAT